MNYFLKMNIALFTSNHLRHKYLSSKIAQSLSLKLIICEEKNKAIQQVIINNEDDNILLENHFQQRKDSEEDFFGEYNNFPIGIALVENEHGSINSQSTLDLLTEYKIDCILLFGTSIIKPFILEKFPNKVINLHLGLSPYYKGSGTNFFPILNNEFECIGATIHLANNNVDEGDILHQFRIDNIQINDNIHQIGNKVIQKAGVIFPIIVEKYLSGKIKSHFQNQYKEAKVYKIKDFTPEALKTANEIISSGGVIEYLRNINQRIATKPIVSCYNE